MPRIAVRTLLPCAAAAAVTIALLASASRAVPVTSAPAEITLRDGEYLVVRLMPGPRWDPNKPRDQQPHIAEHRAYMQSLLADGRMTIGGPFVDDLGGLGVFDASAARQVRGWIDADPCVRAGVMRYDLRHWRAAVRPHAPR
ncbi:MAG: YciI family protein [Phycisphaerae bacterium]